MKVYEKSEEYKKQAVLYRKEKFMDLVGNTDFISGRLPVSGGKGRTFGKREAEGGHVSAVAFSVLPVQRKPASRRDLRENWQESWQKKWDWNWRLWTLQRKIS